MNGLPPSVVVSFSAEINPSTAEQLIATMSRCSNDGVKEVLLLLSTPGGQVMSGMTIYNTLRAMPFDLTVHNVGNVDSIGNVVFLAGNRRLAAPASTFMFHGVGFNSDGFARFEEKLLVERLEGIRADQKRIGEVIADRTDLEESLVRQLFLEQQTKDAEFALTHGLIHEIADPVIPSGVPVLSLVFQR